MKRLLNRKFFFTLVVTIGFHSCCDTTWAVLARYTTVDMWMIVLGIVAWGTFAALILERIWHH